MNVSTEIKDAGLDSCCGGGNSLHAEISLEEILNHLQENSRNNGPEDRSWMAMPLCDLTRYICEKHHRYVREAVPRTQVLLDKVSKHGKNHVELAEIQRLFTEVGREMIMHMQKEEQILFPYIDALELAANSHSSIEPPFFQTVRNPIRMMMKEHDAAGELVRQIRSVTSEYKAPADGCTTFKALYEALREFEVDLHQHVHVEDNVLFPRAVDMESAVADMNLCYL